MEGLCSSQQVPAGLVGDVLTVRFSSTVTLLGPFLLQPLPVELIFLLPFLLLCLSTALCNQLAPENIPDQACTAWSKARCGWSWADANCALGCYLFGGKFKKISLWRPGFIVPISTDNTTKAQGVTESTLGTLWKMQELLAPSHWMWGTFSLKQPISFTNGRCWVVSAAFSECISLKKRFPKKPKILPLFHPPASSHLISPALTGHWGHCGAAGVLQPSVLCPCQVITHRISPQAPKDLWSPCT